MSDIYTMQTRQSSMLSEALRDLLPYTSLGWQLVATILVFFGIGYGLDAWMGTKPWLTVLLSVVGVVTGLISFIRMALALTKRSRNEHT